MAQCSMPRIPPKVARMMANLPALRRDSRKKIPVLRTMKVGRPAIVAAIAALKRVRVPARGRHRSRSPACPAIMPLSPNRARSAPAAAPKRKAIVWRIGPPSGTQRRVALPPRMAPTAIAVRWPPIIPRMDTIVRLGRTAIVPLISAAGVVTISVGMTASAEDLRHLWMGLITIPGRMPRGARRAAPNST